MFDATPVQNQFILEYMPTAKGEHVKVYLYGLMQCYHPGRDMNLTQMSRDLGLSEEEVLAAFRHWERRGLVRRVADHPPAFVYVNVYRQFFARDAAPRDAAYADFAESLYAAFGETRRLHGSETSMAYEWVEEMGLPQEVVLMLIHYMIDRHGKHFSFKAAQKKAVELAENQVQTIEEAEELLSRDQKMEAGLKKLLRRLGKRRAPSEDERALYATWVKEWGFTPEAIEAACPETLKGEPSMQYLGGVLSGMRERAGGGLATAAQVADRMQADRDQAAPLRALLRAMNLQGVTVNAGTLAQYSQMRALYPDAVILLAGEACAKGQGSLDSVLQTLRVWKRRGLQTVEEVQASLAQIDAQNAFLSALFALWERADPPRERDRRLLERWRQTWGFGEEAILLCAERAREAEAPMPYLNRILEDLHTRGAISPEAVAAALAEASAPAQPPRRGKTVKEQQYTQRDYAPGMALPDWVREKVKEQDPHA